MGEDNQMEEGIEDNTEAIRDEVQVEGRVNNKKMELLIDSWSTHNVLDVDIIKNWMSHESDSTTHQ